MTAEIFRIMREKGTETSSPTGSKPPDFLIQIYFSTLCRGEFKPETRTKLAYPKSFFGIFKFIFKVQLFREGHENLHHRPYGVDVY